MITRSDTTGFDIIEEYIHTGNDGSVAIIRRSRMTGKETKCPLIVKDGKVYALEEHE